MSNAQADPVVLEPWAEAGQFGAAVAITTNVGGTSDGPYRSLNLGLHVGDEPERVIANRTRALEAFGGSLPDAVFADQVHGTAVAEVDDRHRGRGTRSIDDALAATDILLTAVAGPIVVIQVADCVPIALVDPAARLLAVVHAGWRGTAARAVGCAMDAMRARGARPERTQAFLGPAVSPSRYQVDGVVRAGLEAAVAPHRLDPAASCADGIDHWLVDLVAANRQQLLLAGLTPDHIVDSGTTSDDGRHFSDRAVRPCGRFALLAQLLP